jgi:hypothetical protein
VGGRGHVGGRVQLSGRYVLVGQSRRTCYLPYAPMTCVRLSLLHQVVGMGAGWVLWFVDPSLVVCG